MLEVLEGAATRCAPMLPANACCRRTGVGGIACTKQRLHCKGQPLEGRVSSNQHLVRYKVLCLLIEDGGSPWTHQCNNRQSDGLTS